MTEENKPMRLAIGQALVEYAKTNQDIVVLDADTSNSTQTKLFAAAFPDRFFNIGIAEANMMSIAAGLSLTGKIPFVSGFAFLLALRAGDREAGAPERFGDVAVLRLLAPLGSCSRRRR